MLASSHAYWTARALAPGARRRWAVLGSVAPDLPAIGQVALLAARGVTRHELLERTYHRSPWREVQLAAHALPAPVAVLLFVPRGRALALVLGWLGHLAIDYASHHDDAWPPLWPASRWRWRSPVSYWQAEHHGTVWAAVEAALVLAAAARDHERWRLAAAVPAFAALVASAAGSGLANALDLSPGVVARARDLET